MVASHLLFGEVRPESELPCARHGPKVVLYRLKAIRMIFGKLWPPMPWPILNCKSIADGGWSGPPDRRHVGEFMSVRKPVILRRTPRPCIGNRKIWSLGALVHQQHRSRHQNPRAAAKQAEVPEQPSAGEKRDGSDHQPNLQKHFAQIESVRLVVGEIRFVLQFTRLSVEFLLLVPVSISFGAIFCLKLRRLPGVFAGDNRSQVGKQLIAVPADVLSLVIGPLVRYLILQNDLFCAGTVSQ